MIKIEDFGPESIRKILKRIDKNDIIKKIKDETSEKEIKAVVMDEKTSKIFRSNLDKTPEGDDYFTRDNSWQSIKRGVMGSCDGIYVMTARNIGEHFLQFYVQDPFADEFVKGDQFVTKNEEVLSYDLLTTCWQLKA